MQSPPDPDDQTEDRSRLFDRPLPGVEAPSIPPVPNLRAELSGLVDDSPLDPAAVEDALADIEVSALDGADLEASALAGDAGAQVDDAADAVTGTASIDGETVTAVVETGGDAARVVLDSGTEAVEIVAENGGEEATEAVLEVAAAALDGL